MIQDLAKLLYAVSSQGLAVLLLATVIGCASKKPMVDDRPAAFWPPYPNEPRIQFLASYSQSSDIAPPRSKLDDLIYGKEPQQVLPLNKPYGVRMWNGRIYVCDIRHASVTILDLKNRQTLVIGKSGSNPMQSPTDIAIAPDGMKYVADAGRGAVFVFDAADRQVAMFGEKDFKPVGVAVYQNELYVCDFQSQRVQVLDRHSGKVLRSIGEPGPEPGQFVRPLGVAVDAQGYIYVSDALSCLIQKFDREGNLVMHFGTVSANAGGLVRPKHIAVDREGIIYVVDAAFQNVQLFDQQGRVLTFFGSSGPHPGAMFLPVGICVHEGDVDLFQDLIHPAFKAERLVLVTNQFGDNKVSVYALGHLREGKTVADVSASKGIVPEGTSDAPTTGPGAPITEADQARESSNVPALGPAAPTTQEASQP